MAAALQRRSGRSLGHVDSLTGRELAVTTVESAGEQRRAIEALALPFTRSKRSISGPSRLTVRCPGVSRVSVRSDNGRHALEADLTE
jgi:hypothetical protein